MFRLLMVLGIAEGTEVVWVLRRSASFAIHSSRSSDKVYRGLHHAATHAFHIYEEAT
jgi:hypothetical protein